MGKQLIVRKGSLTLHCRTVTKYDLDDLIGIRAVWRGVNTNNVQTEHYSIVFEFKGSPDSSRTNDCLSSEDEEGFIQVPPKPKHQEQSESEASESETELPV